MKAIIAMLFILVLCVDFLSELDRKHPRVSDLLIRGSMIVACAYLFKGVSF